MVLNVVKREFISAFHGGNGGSYFERGFEYFCEETSQSTNPLYRESLIELMMQCVIMLEYFGIKVTHPKERNEDGRVVIYYRISSKQENLIRYFKTIGYRYNRYKIIGSAKVIEYLMRVKKYAQLVKTIREYYGLKKTCSEIANLLNLDKKYVRGVINTPRIPNLGGDNIGNWDNWDNWDNWLEKFEDKSYCLFVPLESIEEVKEALVSDITVESYYHSFIAGNNFLSSNCLRTRVAQLITRLSFVQKLSHLRRISSSIGKDGKLVKPRQLHNSYWCYICPSETPEDSSCSSPEELVLMADGSRKKIKDVVVGDEVITFNPETCDTTSTRVIRQFIKKADNRVYKIITCSGREIIATEDHKFMTILKMVGAL